MSTSPRRRAIHLALLLAILALAAGLRLYRLADFPPGLFIDQAQYGLDAYRISRGETFPVFVAGPTKERGREPLFMYLMAVVFLAIGPTPVAIKLTSALIGIATVLVAYLAARRFLGERVGLLTAALLAVSRWHLTFSRMGFRAVLTPLWVSLVVLALGWLLRRPTPRTAALFGAVVAAGFYTYPAYWSVPIALVLVAAAALWERRGWAAATVRRIRPLIAAGTVAFVLVSAPLAIYAAVHADDLLARAREVALVGGHERPYNPDEKRTTLLDGMQRVLLMLHVRGDSEPRHNVPGRPMLDLVSGLAFLAGLVAIAKAPWSRPTKIGLVALWLLPLLPSAVTLAAPNALRAVGAIPAVCAIAAVGLDATARVAERGVARLRRTATSGRAPRLAALALLAAALAVAAVANVRAYFVDWGTQAVLPSEFSADIPRFVDYLHQLAADADVVVCPYVYSSPNVHFLTLRQEPPLQPLDDVDALLAGPPRVAADRSGGVDRDGAIERASAHRPPPALPRDRVFVCDEPATNALIHRLYPGAEEIGRYAIYTMRTGRVIRVPASQLWVRLPPSEEEQASYFVRRMNESFAERSRAW